MTVSTSGQGIKFIGDLSAQDAALLARYASGARSVLEFGAGGSTQIIAQALCVGGSFVSIDTDPQWIATTRTNLRRLGVEDRCQFLSYDEWSPDATQFDLVFNDGLRNLRRDFAHRSFPQLTIGGTLLFHDTRRRLDVCDVTSLVEVFFEEIDQVQLNERFDGSSSNITSVRKKAREPYVDWNAAEGRPPWAYGRGTVPDEFWPK